MVDATAMYLTYRYPRQIPILNAGVDEMIGSFAHIATRKPRYNGYIIA